MAKASGRGRWCFTRDQGALKEHRQADIWAGKMHALPQSALHCKLTGAVMPYGYLGAPQAPDQLLRWGHSLAGPLRPHRRPPLQTDTGAPCGPPHHVRATGAAERVGRSSAPRSNLAPVAWAAASQALWAGPPTGLDARLSVHTWCFPLRPVSAYPCHKLSPTSTEGFRPAFPARSWLSQD